MSAWRLFEVAGIELEYMIVSKDTLDVAPICDVLMKQASGGEKVVDELAFGEIGWSNELVNHVLEFKTIQPAPFRDLHSYAEKFQAQVTEANRQLDSLGAMLLPGAMHPWMNPETQTVLWPEAYNEIYEAYNRIFDCRGHGWANLQSTHINLPFQGNDEFAKLMAAIRYLMPVMPMLTAASPFANAAKTNFADYRLHVYKSNSARVPSVTGNVIPEPVFSIEAYKNEILGNMYRDIAPHDHDRILQEEWLNARGAIARFDRNAIEIRVLDIQECPAADIAIAMLLCQVLQGLATASSDTMSYIQNFDSNRLRAIYDEGVSKGSKAVIQDRDYLAGLGFSGVQTTAGELWSYLYQRSGLKLPQIEHILDYGCLAQRLLDRLEKECSLSEMKKKWTDLAFCLATGKQF